MDDVNKQYIIFWLNAVSNMYQAQQNLNGIEIPYNLIQKLNRSNELLSEVVEFLKEKTQ